MSDETGTGTPQPAGVGAGTQPAPVNVPQQPELEKVKFSDQTTYELPKGFQVPDPIAKGIAEKDKTIAKLKKEAEAMKSQQQGFERIERALTTLREQPDEPPDPFSEPEKYRDWLRQDVMRSVLKEQEKNEKLFLATVGELQTLQNLTGGDQDKYDAVINFVRENGWGHEENGKYCMSPNTAEAAYYMLYKDEVIAKAKGEGVNQVRNDLNNAQQAAISVPSGTAGGATQYRNLGELLRKDPAEFQRRKKEASESFGLPSKDNYKK